MIIFYGLCGEGLGHAIRVQAVLEHLDNDLEVHLFTWGEAYDFFANYKHLHRIVGVPFGRDKNNYVNFTRSVMNFAKFQWHCSESIDDVVYLAEKLNPVVFISDCEPIIPKVARKLDKPLMSIDNQHKFSRCVSEDLPYDLWFYTWIMGIGAEMVCPSPDFVVVSTFYHSAVKKKFCDKTILTNCFMRKSIENQPSSDGDYVLLYYKVSCGAKILDVIGLLGEPVTVYNCPLDRRVGMPNVKYRDISNEGFIKDLAGCRCLFASAGNQLLGEAVYYGKPVFAIPEPNQPEQTINAYYLEKMGSGLTCALDDFNIDMARKFVNEFVPIKEARINGVYTAIEEIKKMLLTSASRHT